MVVVVPLATIGPVVSAVTVPWLAACAVLGVAGIAKLRRPEPTMGALRAAHLPSRRAVVLVLGGAEVLLAITATTSGWAGLAVAVAVLHLGFAAFVVATLRRGGMLQTCGCFGSPDVPAGPIHVVVDLAVVVVALAAAAGEPGTLQGLLTGGTEGIVALGLVVLATFQLLVVLTVLPRARLGAASPRFS